MFQLFFGFTMPAVFDYFFSFWDIFDIFTHTHTHIFTEEAGYEIIYINEGLTRKGEISKKWECLFFVSPVFKADIVIL